MATNPYAPNGLSVGGSRTQLGAAGNYANIVQTIKAAYGTSIGRGDLVNFGTGTYQGYVVSSALADTSGLGVFSDVYPYYDLTAQQTMHGLNGAYTSAANPSADIPCSVVVDPFVTFIAQCNGSTFAQSWVGQNINFVAGTNGAPNISGQSTLALDPATISTDDTLPLRIVGVVGTAGSPMDPTAVNPWLEVRLNTSWLLSRQGI